MKIWTEATHGAFVIKPSIWREGKVWMCSFGPFCEKYRGKTPFLAYYNWHHFINAEKEI